MKTGLRRLLLLVPVLAAMALAACQDREPEQPAFDNEENAAQVPEPDNVMPAPEPEAEPDNALNVARAAPPPEISDEQQMLDDAAAVGMTARLPRDGSGEPHQGAPAADKGDLSTGRNGGEAGQNP
ncbi:hypothetical protein PX699_26065 [Sphingobium sp. H39-3-25]|uniref:hypothetical protein n=1 Tax=Sphingobium arseniciresistens TaxID=3030834 RepID=UPI0023B9086F|nr:hypothetical protein [Sphingobium arseniciresistens]